MKDDLNVSLKVREILDLFRKKLVFGPADKFYILGEEHLKNQLHKFVVAEECIDLILPGFPCKSPNHKDKVLASTPDYGEHSSLIALERFCASISKVYAPGCVVTIFSDGTTFADIVGVGDQEVDAYNLHIRYLADAKFILWCSLDECLGQGLSPDGTREKLLQSYGCRTGSANEISAQTPPMTNHLLGRYDDTYKLLAADGVIQSSSTNSAKTDTGGLHAAAGEMLQRGQALDKLIKDKFPSHIRLSVHQQENSGEKYSFSVGRDDISLAAPWHNVPVLTDSGKIRLMPRSKLNEASGCYVRFEGRPWLFLESSDDLLNRCDISVVKNGNFGVRISAPKISEGNTLNYNALNPRIITHLLDEYGFVVLSGFDMSSEEVLVDFTCQFGTPYIWDFGPVHKVKPYDKPDGFVHSLEKVPLHWDLSMLPLDHEKVKEDEYFSATYFSLYCKGAPTKNDGQTTLVDGREVLRHVSWDRLRSWEKTSLTYNTKKTYFGGIPRTYPLVAEHPKTRDRVLRYQEGSMSSLQEFVVENESVDAQKSNEEVSYLNECCYSEVCLVEHAWSEGELVLVDNHRVLHGRNAMDESSQGRELWRVQVF